ncbi:MAG TPA: TetR/AcrR family transcriptional regulator [Aquabacterium sp.]|nr:TetR/AcrR family transcriptional regulator [Aquabacterium sp.]
MHLVSAPTDVRQHILDTAQAIIGGKGFAAVGLNEILRAADVPKGSFYHYFGSKEAFGEALLEAYFTDYLARLDTLLGQPGVPAAEKLMRYWHHWLDTQATCDSKGKCLAVKLAAEVSDLSEAMRAVLQQGTDRIIDRLAQAIDEAVADGSLQGPLQARDTATTLYQLWLGASLRAKITRDRAPLESALSATHRLLGRLDQPVG